MTIDPRLIERRKTVAEDKAHRSMRRLLRFLVLAVLVGALIWLALSPLLSVAQVRTAGIVSGDSHAVLAREGVVAGTPMILLRTGDIEDALEADPWVREAEVTLDWPNEVVVRVTERVPVLWVESREGWSWRAVDGVPVPGPAGPDNGSPRLFVPDLTEADLDNSQLIEGAATFVDSLPGELSRGLTMTLEEGELWAETDGFPVRLGRPIEMQAKALSLTALLREKIPEGSTLILVAPANPAIAPPGPDPSNGDGSSEGDAAGPAEGEGEG